MSETLSSTQRSLLAESVAPLGSWELDLRTQRIRASAGASRIYGLTGDGWPWDEIKNASLPEYREMLDAVFARLLSARHPVDAEYRIRRVSDGAIRDIHTVAEYDVDRQVVMGVVSDDTERRMAERALRESETRYRMLADNLGDVIWLLDLRTGRFEYASPSVERLHGYTLTEALDLPLQALVTPDAWVRIERLLAARLPAFTERDPSTWTFTDEIDQVHKDGRIIPTEVVSRLLPGPDGAITKVLGVSRDISERRRAEAALRASEERFEKAFRASPVPMTLSVIAPGRYIDVNDRFCALSGWTRDEAIGHTAVELNWVTNEQRSAALAAIEAEGRTVARETMVRTRSGEERTCLLSGEVLELNRVPCLLAMVLDITALRRSEAERAALETQVQHLKRMDSIGRLAGGVAHDMNNVLTAILTLAELQHSESDEGSALHADMETIVQACLRGQSTVRSLLNFARADVSTLDLLDLNELVQHEVALLERTTLQRAHLRAELEDGLPAIHGDRAALGHVLMNLCLNAIDAMPQGGTLAVRTRRDGDKHVVIDVIDSGVGMPPEVLEKALDPFFTPKPQGEGTGLGLSIVFGTIKAHGGTMNIHSVAGEGTTVSVRLPVATAVIDSPL